MIYETNGYEKMRWAGYDGDDPVFDVLSGVSDGRGILHGAQETGVAGSGHGKKHGRTHGNTRARLDAGSSIGGASMASGAVVLKRRDMMAWRRSVVKRRGAVVYEMNGYEKMRWAAAQQKKGSAIYL